MKLDNPIHSPTTVVTQNIKPSEHREHKAQAQVHRSTWAQEAKMTSRHSSSSSSSSSRAEEERAERKRSESRAREKAHSERVQ